MPVSNRMIRLPVDRVGLLLVAWLWVTITASTARPDEFLLKSGGRVEGELLNRDQSPRTTYVIRTEKGDDITLDASQVTQVRLQSDSQRAYERWLPKMPNTAEGNWKMAVWCGNKKLRKQEQFHLAEVIRLDPDHERARRRLGYHRLGGRWVKPAEFNKERGYQLKSGRYRTRQDVEAMGRRDQQEQAEKQWKRQIKRIRDGLRKGRSGEMAREQMLAIRDPSAIAALVNALASEKDRSFKSLCVEILGQFEGSTVTTALVRGALDDPDEEIRLQYLDQLEQRQDVQAVDAFISALRSPDNERINRAGAGLRRLKDPAAIPYLIDAVKTKHVYQAKSNPGQIGAFFPRGEGRSGRGLGGLSMGGKAKRVEVVRENRAVLDALIALSGGVNLQYDTNRWRQWYVSASTPPNVNLRRSE